MDTLTDLNVIQEKRVDDFWNVDSNRNLSDSRKGYTKFNIMKEKRRLTKVQTTARPDHVWPQVWTKIGNAAQNREKQEWKNEQPKLDDAPDVPTKRSFSRDEWNHLLCLLNIMISLSSLARNGESSRQLQHGNWKKSRVRRRLFLKHKETKRKPFEHISLWSDRKAERHAKERSRNDFHWRFIDGEAKTNGSSEGSICGTSQHGFTQPMEREGKSSAGFGISRQSGESRWGTRWSY